MATHNMQPVMIRAISLFVAMVFAVTTLVGSPSEAQAAAGAFEFLSGNNGMTQLRQGLNAIPVEWGTVNAIWEPAEKKPGSPFIVHIQDAHSNPEAAQNIASILNYLSEKHPAMVIGLEGAAGALHSEYLNFFSDYPEANLAVINDLKQKGELNGADLFLLGKGRPSGREIQVGNISLEYGSLSSVKPPEVRGVETAELYLEDLRIFRDLLSKQDEMQVLLNPIRSRLEKESSQKLNGELRNFLKERSRRKEGRFGLSAQAGLSMTPARSRGLGAPSSQADPNLQAYANYLCKQVLKFLGIDLSDSIEQLRFPNLMRVQRISQAQQKFDAEKIKAEWTEVLKVLTALAKDTGEQDFIAALATFAREQGFIDEAAGRDFSYPVERALYPRKLLEGLFLFKQKHPIDFARYGAFLKSWELVALHAEIDVTELLKEMSALEDQLVLVLAKTDEEKELVRQVTQLDLLKKLLQLELSRPEYDGVIASREAIEALAKDQGPLAPLVEQAFLFYEISLKRDNALVENLLALTRGERGTGNIPRVLVLYTGGFHSAGIEEILRSKGIGYAEIAPKTRSVDRGELYQKVMAGDNADLTAYFKVKNPFSTKQEAIFFKELIEIGAPALFEKYQLKPDQIASNVRQAIDAHPVLSKAVMAERSSGENEGSSVTFQTRPNASVQSANSAAMPPDLLGNGIPVITGGARQEVRATVKFNTPLAFQAKNIPTSTGALPSAVQKEEPASTVGVPNAPAGRVDVFQSQIFKLVGLTDTSPSFALGNQVRRYSTAWREFISAGVPVIRINSLLIRSEMRSPWATDAYRHLLEQQLTQLVTELRKQGAWKNVVPEMAKEILESMPIEHLKQAPLKRLLKEVSLILALSEEYVEQGLGEPYSLASYSVNLSDLEEKDSHSEIILISDRPGVEGRLQWELSSQYPAVEDKKVDISVWGDGRGTQPFFRFHVLEAAIQDSAKVRSLMDSEKIGSILKGQPEYRIFSDEILRKYGLPEKLDAIEKALRREAEAVIKQEAEEPALTSEAKTIVINGAAGGMPKVVFGEAAIWEPASKKMNISMVRPYDTSEVAAIKIQNEVAAFEKMAGPLLEKEAGAEVPQFKERAGQIFEETRKKIRDERIFAQVALRHVIQEIREQGDFEDLDPPEKKAVRFFQDTVLPAMEKRENLIFDDMQNGSVNLIQLQQERFLGKLFEKILRLPYGFNTNNSSVIESERQLADARARSVLDPMMTDPSKSMLDVILSAISGNERGLPPKIAIQRAVEQNIDPVVMIFKKKVDDSPTPAQVDVRNYEFFDQLRTFWLSIIDEIDTYDFIHAPNATEDEIKKAKADELQKHQLVFEKAMKDVTVQGPEYESFNEFIRREIDAKGRPVGYLAARFFADFYQKKKASKSLGGLSPSMGWLRNSDRDFWGFLMRYYDYAEYGFEDGRNETPYVVFAQNIRDEIDYNSLRSQFKRRGRIVAIVSPTGTLLSHWPIFAQKEGIIAVPSANFEAVGIDVSQVKAGALVLVDGRKGLVALNPSSRLREQWLRRGEHYSMMQKFYLNRARMPVLFEGKQIAVGADEASVEAVDGETEENTRIYQYGADFIGLMRLEEFFLHMQKEYAGIESDPERLALALRKFISSPFFKKSNRPLIARLFDPQGDKLPPKPWWGKNPDGKNRTIADMRRIVAKNRSIRFYIDPEYPEFSDNAVMQIQAVLTAYAQEAQHEGVKLLIPDVVSENDVKSIEGLVERAKNKLVPAQQGKMDLPVGFMYERRGAYLSPTAKFYGIGSNDLLQDILQVSRDDPKAALRLRQLSPTLVQEIYRVGSFGESHGISVTLEGEWAASRRMMLMLLLMRLDGVGVTPVMKLAKIPELKEFCRNINPGELREKLGGYFKRAIQGDQTLSPIEFDRVIQAFVDEIEERITAKPEYIDFVRPREEELERERLKDDLAGVRPGTPRAELRGIARAGAMAGLTGVPASAISLQRSEMRESDVEAILQLPAIPGAYQSQRSLEAGNATGEILRMESLSSEILKHVFGGEPNQRLEGFQKNSLIEAWQKLEKDIKKFDLDRVMEGIEIMDPASVRDEGNIVTGSTVVAAVPVTLTLDLSHLRSDMAHDARSVKITETTSGHPAFIHSIKVGGVERSMFEMAIERVLSKKASVLSAARSELGKIVKPGEAESFGRSEASTKSELRNLEKYPIYLGDFLRQDSLGRGSDAIFEMLRQFLNGAGFTVVSGDNDSKLPRPAVAILRYNGSTAEKDIQKLKDPFSGNPNVKIILIIGDTSISFSEEELKKATHADALLYLPLDHAKLLKTLDTFTGSAAALPKSPLSAAMPKMNTSSPYQQVNKEDITVLQKLFGMPAEGQPLGYWNRYLRDGKGRLYLVKYEHKLNEFEKRRFIWGTKDSRDRQLFMMELLRRLGCNVVDIVVPEEAERRWIAEYLGFSPDDKEKERKTATIHLVSMASNYKLTDGEIQQRNLEKALTASFLAAVLTRWYDYHTGNQAPVKSTAIGFDQEQALSQELASIEKFTEQFIANYFKNYSFEKLSLLDLDELVAFIKRVKDLDLAAFKADYDKEHGVEIAGKVAPTQVYDEYFQYIADRQKKFPEDLGKFFKLLQEQWNIASGWKKNAGEWADAGQTLAAIPAKISEATFGFRSETRQEEVVPEVTDKIVIRKSFDFSLDHYIRNVLFNLKGGASFLLESPGIRDSSMFPSMKVAADGLMTMLEKLESSEVQIVQEKGRLAISLGDNGWGPDAKRQWVKSEAWQDFKAKLGLEKDFLGMHAKAEEIQRILKKSRRTESDLSAVIAASDAILAVIDAIREKSISVDRAEAGKPAGLSVPEAREFTNRERMINLLQHDLNGKLLVLLNAEDAADISKERLKETVREALVVFRIFDLEQFKSRDGKLFIPEGRDDVFAYNIRSVRSQKVYQTPSLGTMPRGQSFDGEALRQIADEVGFDKIRILFAGEVMELEQLRDELLRPGDLTPALRSRTKVLAERIHQKIGLLFERLTAESVPVTAGPARVIKKVLLVDDEDLLRKVLVMQLKGLGYEVGSAANGREALQQLQTGNFDLVITDVTMPLMGGIELVENMRTGGINLPVIFMSGATSWFSSGSLLKSDDLKKREPYADFLQKPFMVSDMKDAIMKISGSPSTQDLRSETREEKVTDEAVIGKALDFALRSHNIPNALNIIEGEAYSWERRGRDSAFLELIDAVAGEMKTMLEKLKAPNVQIVRNKEFQAIFLGNVGWGSNPDTVDVDPEAWAKYKTKLDLGKDIVRMQEKADLIRGIVGNLKPEATNLSTVKEASQSIRAIVEEIHQKIFPSEQPAANKPMELFRPSPKSTMQVDRVESISPKTPKVEDVDQLKRELARDLQRNILKETLGNSTEFVAKLIASWRWKTPGKAESVAVDVKEFRGSLDRLTSDQLRNLATAVMNNKRPPFYDAIRNYELSGLNSRLSEWETNKLGNIFSWQETAREKARLADARGDFEDRNRYDLAAVIKADDWAKIKNILASAYAKDLLLPRSEVRMSNTDDYKRELEQNTTPTAELSVQSDMLGAINSTAKQLGFYSEQGIASYASGWSPVQIRSWIASQLLAPLRIMATEQKISNERLKTILDGLKQFVVNGAAEKPDLLGQGPALHVRLPQLSEVQWQAFLKDVPVLLGALVSFRANIYFNVHADSKRAAEMEAELRQTVQTEGVELADKQVRFFSIPEGSGFASLKTGKVDARLSEEVRFLQLGSKLGTAWKGSEESRVDMRTLAAEITTVLYAILDEKVNADWNRIHAPEQYSSELFRAVLGALEAYESIKQAA